jgi:hypothetical protein
MGVCLSQLTVDGPALVPANSIIVGICGEIDQKTEFFFKDELEDFVAAVWRDCPAFTIGGLAATDAFVSGMSSGENQHSATGKIVFGSLRFQFISPVVVWIRLIHLPGFVNSSSRTLTTVWPCRRSSQMIKLRGCNGHRLGWYRHR